MEEMTGVGIDASQIESIVRTVPGGRSNIQDIGPLSALQEALLFDYLLNDQSDNYVVSGLFELDRHVTDDRLIAALQVVVERHDALRTAVFWEGLPRPLQVIWRRAAVPAKKVVLDPGRDVLEQLKVRMMRSSELRDVRCAPLIRLELAEDTGSAARYALVHVHRLICDHQSARIVIREMMLCLSGRAQELSATTDHGKVRARVPMQAERAEAFFRRKLGDVDEVTAPFGLLRVQGGENRVTEARRAIASPVARKLRMQASRYGVGAARVFHAAWGLVLAHLSGRNTVVFGTLLSLARKSGVRGNGTVGVSVNTLPLRLSIQGVSVRELLEEAHRELAQLLRYGHTPLNVAHGCSGIPGAAPLFTTVLNYRNSTADGEETLVRQAGVREIGRGEAWTKYPIAVAVDDFGEEFHVKVLTDRRIDPERVTDYLEQALQSMVEALEQAPETAAASLVILPERERRQLLETFNGDYARIYILDCHQHLAPLGVVGEIHIGGACVARGYFNEPGLAAGCFVADPFSPDPLARMYKTGDRGRRLADGTIEYVGRHDQQVSLRGVRIEIGEIEAQLLRCRFVRDAAVLVQEGSSGEKHLVAYVTLRNEELAANGIAKNPHRELGIENLRSHLKALLPAHMIPNAFVVLPDLPMTTEGKLDRLKLSKLEATAYWSSQYEPPKGKIEEALAALWREVLRVEKVGRDDDFFELGGYSLLGMQLIMRIGEMLGTRPPVASILRYRTVRQMAKLVEMSLSESPGSREPGQVDIGSTTTAVL
jgi:acyl carrier protein